MKYSKVIFLTMFLFITHVISAQLIPVAVKSTFESKYPDASQIRWSILEKNSGFQVGFLSQKKHRYAVFSGAAHWVQTTTIVNTKAELPRLVRSVIDETYPNHTYDWMEWFESPDENYYIIAVTSGTEEKEETILTVTREGQIRSVPRDNQSHRQL